MHSPKQSIRTPQEIKAPLNMELTLFFLKKKLTNNFKIIKRIKPNS